MRDYINGVFDVLQLVAERLAVLHRLIVEVALLGLLLLGLNTLFKIHP
jgi:hypothetical protein